MDKEEDRCLLFLLSYYGLKSPDVYYRIKKDITESPAFRFDRFFKSRMPQELSRCCHTLLGKIAKEYENKVKEDQQKKHVKGLLGKKRSLVDVADVESSPRAL
ncbi:slide-domain-containing protein [Hysterangium stoloniferum]|nr:slide-domain-containing protein [Hysterangium stoloniferum]